MNKRNESMQTALDSLFHALADPTRRAVVQQLTIVPRAQDSE